MKVLIRTQVIFLLILIFHLSCKKELSCENCIANHRPIASAGIDQSVTLPLDSVVVDGSASSDSDGSISSFLWRNITSMTSNIVSPNMSKTTIRALLAGVYQFELIVTDDKGLSAVDTVQIHVNQQQIPDIPYPCIGPHQTIILPLNNATLGGHCSENSPGITYRWKQISGPAPAVIADPNAHITLATALVKGLYEFELTVTSTSGFSVSNTLQITVK